ncbi:hypothetical protein [Devosia sp. A369]
MMFRSALILALVAAPLAGVAQGRDFSSAIEPVPVLTQLYDEADSRCRLAKIDSVEVDVACVSSSIYGVALNDKNWCRGRQGQSNAEMDWHECGEDSMRFPPVELPGL